MLKSSSSQLMASCGGVEGEGGSIEGAATKVTTLQWVYKSTEWIGVCLLGWVFVWFFISFFYLFSLFFFFSDFYFLLLLGRKSQGRADLGGMKRDCDQGTLCKTRESIKKNAMGGQKMKRIKRYNNEYTKIGLEEYELENLPLSAAMNLDIVLFISLNSFRIKKIYLSNTRENRFLLI